MYGKLWPALVVGLWLVLSSSIAQAVTVTVTINEIEIDDVDFDTGHPLERAQIQYNPVFGDFIGKPTTRPGTWSDFVPVCVTNPTDPECMYFVSSPNWVFSTEAQATDSPFTFRFVVYDEVVDVSPWGLAFARPDSFVGLHERGLREQAFLP